MAVTALTASSPAMSQEAGSMRTDRIAGLPDFVDGILAQQLAQEEVVGAVVAVVADGKPLFSRGYGFADIERGIPVDANQTLFRVASVTKLFTFTALMQLVDAGKVDLDAPVDRYLDFPIPATRAHPILVKHLLDHSAGFEDNEDIAVDGPSKFQELGTWLRTHLPARVREPGAEISYSNYGATLAGYIVQRVCGEAFSSYVDRHVLRPLGMSSSTFSEPVGPNVAVGYKHVDGRLIANPYEYYHNVMPAGGLSSTGEDMMRFMVAELNGGASILPAAVLKEMWETRRANAAGLPGLAAGFLVYKSEAPRIVGHGGDIRDFHSIVMLIPEAKFGLFVSLSTGKVNIDARTDIQTAIIGRLFPAVASKRLLVSSEKPLLGTYRTNRRNYSAPPSPKQDLIVEAVDDSTIRTRSSRATIIWERIGPDLYEQVSGTRPGGPYNQLKFHGDAADPKLSLSQSPHILYRYVAPPATVTSEGN